MERAELVCKCKGALCEQPVGGENSLSHENFSCSHNVNLKKSEMSIWRRFFLANLGKSSEQQQVLRTLWVAKISAARTISIFKSTPIWKDFKCQFENDIWDQSRKELCASSKGGEESLSHENFSCSQNSVANAEQPRTYVQQQLFSRDPSYRRDPLYKWKFCLSVCLYFINSTFSIKILQIIPESSQTPHIIHHWREEDFSHDDDNCKDTHKDKYKDKDEDNDRDNTIWDGGSTAPAKQLIPQRTQDFLH